MGIQKKNHRFANFHKNINIVWGIEKNDGSRVTYFSKMVVVRVNYFHILFKKESKATIVAVIEITNYFPKFFSQEDNQNLMVEVSKEELL